MYESQGQAVAPNQDRTDLCGELDAWLPPPVGTITTQQLLCAVESAKDGIAILNVQGEYLYLNRAHLELFGYSELGCFLGKTWQVFYPDFEIHRCEQEILPILQTQGHWQGELIGKRLDGSLFEHELSLNITSTGELVCICRDIHQRLAEERQQQASHERQQQQNQALINLSRSSSLHQGNLQQILAEITQTSVVVLGLDRAAIFLYNETGTHLVCQSFHGNDLATPLEQLSLAEAPTYFQALASRRVMPTRNAQRDQRFQEFWANYLQPFNIQATINAPIMINGEMVGLLCYEIVGQERQWSDQDQSFTASVADLVALTLEICQRQQAEVELLESQERYALAILGANDGIWDWDLRKDCIYYSPRWKEILGHTDAEIGVAVSEWFNRIHPEDVEAVRQCLMAHLLGQVSHFEQEYRMQHRHGMYRWVLSRGIAVRYSNGEAYRIAGSLTDTTERHEVAAQLQHEALHDPLTHLPNRNLLMDRLSQAVEAAQQGRQTLFAVIFIDLDRFKLVNDSLGHQAGDQLLVECAKRLYACVEPEQTVARLGSDEFVILLENLTEPGAAMAVTDRIQQSIQEPFRFQGLLMHCTASIGIALNLDQAIAPVDYLRNANLAMYQAKSRGGASHALFTEAMYTSAINRLQVETDLRRAIDNQEFYLQYQPIVDLVGNRIIGFEALIRWQHPQKGMISPGQFISIAEETGLIVPMGQWVLRQSCQQMQEWQQLTGRPLLISVNLSSKQLVQPNLVDQIDQILAETGLPSQTLKLEITESMILENIEASRQTLLELKRRQIQLSMDDFGTGYSSLNYLHRLPLDLLKIDRSFINEMVNAEESLELVRAIISIARSLKMHVIAEGIETQEQAELLQTLGCEFGQGYFFARPLDSHKALACLSA